ncbi:SAM-dependent methyltransferase [Paenibacillus qinlingensis]|uniref:Tetratricopeptide (TPR) repeat protein n=1 Tax=Paenibacillus qinlingensis TaxID=1837343 RepID=A0ABU1NQT8_9BACL|nr:SAM-dependent methyltransferase [Paenibacillus qinlingensis]MDR6549841.1 tetratricopeptide (TPR) repeat protein [Paenibacillus qinlingensis]
MTQTEPKTYRFSEAPIWELQRSYYEEQGITAWQSGDVPQYITSNRVMAISYAEMIFAFLQDRARIGELTERVMILELGAGSGQFAFYVLQELTKCIEVAGIPLPPFRYVMSDLAEKNVTFWRQHAGLAPFVELGVLDFARFDAVQDRDIYVQHVGERVGPGDLAQPLVIVANYFFDSLPQELIYIEDGHVYDCRISLQFPEGAHDWSASQQLKEVIGSYHYQRDQAYDDDAYPYRDVLNVYRQHVSDSHILLPEVSLRCLARLQALSQNGFMLLTADKGDHRLESWAYNEPPKLIHHGSISLTANYHAISYVCEAKGAQSLFTKHPYTYLNIGCILHVPDPALYGLTRLAYERCVERFGPDDFFNLKESFDTQIEQKSMPQLLALWRLSGYDTQFLLPSTKHLIHLIPECGEHEWIALQQGIHRMWAHYYPMDSNTDVALACGILLYQMDLYQEAIPYFERTQPTMDHDATVLYEMAVCYYELGQDHAAKQFVDRTIAIQPEHEEALALRDLLLTLE